MRLMQYSRFLNLSIKSKALRFKTICKTINFSQPHSTSSELEKNYQSECIWGSNSSVNNLVNKNFKVYENFVSEAEEENLLKEIDPIFKRRRYQFDHWDGAIQGYKETEKDEWNEENFKVIQRIKEFAFSSKHNPMKHVHVLDLSKTGHIKPHVDSIKFCGSVIAGLSLLSSSVMRLTLESDKSQVVDVLLRRRSLYIMKDAARYDFMHEILADSSSNFKGVTIPRDRRISLMCRLEPEIETEQN